MSKQYWEEYYKNEQPSSFAKFCLFYIPKNSSIIDVGCGNGRDTKYFNNRFVTYGVDYASNACAKMSLKELMKNKAIINVVYSRFFLHCISNREIIDFIKWTPEWFMAEFRVKGDKPKLFKDHERNFVNFEWLLSELKRQKFKIVYSKKGRGMAKYRNEDPLVGRVIAKRVSI